MGNMFKKERTYSFEIDEDSVYTVGNSIYTVGGIMPHSKQSLDFSDEEPSDLSTSSCTKPTVFNSQDTTEHSSQSKAEDVEAVIISAEQLENIYEQYKVMHPESSELIFMPQEVLATVTHLFEKWQNDMIYNFDIYENYARSDKNMLRIYGDFLSHDNLNIENKFLRHSVGIVITYKMILDGIELNKADELIEQLAIGHGLHGITGEDFKVLDLHFTRYLLQRNLINDESIIAMVGFFFIVSDKITKVLVHRRSQAQSSISSEVPIVGRSSITRDNYRCMKKWAKETAVIHSKIDIIQRQIRLYKPEDKLELDTATLATEKLKANNFLMNIFHKKKTEKQ
ncbi:hypothetical protein WA026_000057 [Henosepilachna vigintioctopunctata]|uniref:Globin family profile domain-containing protein n=1 Tax=Henosepilachna vigintioctopunctata TaxID=420089 RepID=A0AAW1UW93_9CUCU